MAKILVIDDDAAIVDLLRLRLADLGHQVLSAMDATAGMMIAAREKPDLITLDFQMPAGDGAKVYERLRGNTFTAKTKIIFISGMSEYDLEHSVPSDPAVRFLQKP
ncbi:MAG TPA: response regulator, partial [Elusimicrobiota bacterium]|nr:response regulator [Elusimicrobiota bacterium]